MLSDKEKIKQLEKMLRQSQKKLELSEKKRRQAEEQLIRADITMKRVEDRIDSGDLTLATVLSLLNKAIDKLLPTDMVDLPHERLRVLKELLLEVQFDVSGADQISGLLRYLKNKGTEKAKKLLRENARSIPQKVDELWKAAEGAIRKGYWPIPLRPPSKGQNWHRRAMHRTVLCKPATTLLRGAENYHLFGR